VAVAPRVARTEPPLIPFYSANSVVVAAASKEQVCQELMPELFHPELQWQNTSFYTWGSGNPRYAYSELGFACTGSSTQSQNDVRYVGFVYCATSATGDSQAWWYVDSVRERCVCVPGSFITENGKCVAPHNSKCTLTVDGVCHGGTNNGGTCPTCGNPINPANGNKFHSEPVYVGLGGFRLDLSYNTQDEESSGRFGRRWRDSFDRRIAVVGSMAVAFRPDGKGRRFLPSGGNWIADANNPDRLTELRDPLGTRTGWTLYVAEGDQLETYDAAGRLLGITPRNGPAQTLAYSDGTSGPNGGVFVDASGNATALILPAGFLTRAVDGYGRGIRFNYTTSTRVATVTDPGGGVYRFAYDDWNRTLLSVTFPDGQVRRYHYAESAYTGGTIQILALTGITDENGDRFATYKYDAQGRAVSTEHAGGALRYTLTYGATSTTVSDPLGVARSYAFQTILGTFSNIGITGPACPSCGPASQIYDANGNVASRTDWNGNRTDYGYDVTRNLETRRAEGLTIAGAPTPETRTISTEWHPTWRLPTRIAEPLRITSFVYNGDGGTTCGLYADGTTPVPGVLCSKAIQATTDADGSQGFAAAPVGAPRIRQYTYNANGLVLTADGPRTDVPDITSTTYYADDDPDPGKRSNVAAITNAAGHTTNITGYNAHGQPTTIVDPNGLVMTLAYDARQRLTSRTVGTETTSYAYDGVGQLVRVTLPDSSFLAYTYDAAHRLTGMADSQGNSIAYTLDAMGNRLKEDVYDPSAVLAQTRSRVYDDLNRLFQKLGAAGQTTEYGYDNQGNVVSVKDPLSRVTSNQYDALNRLARVIDPNLGQTHYGYNGLDALTSVTDPRGLVSAYSVDGLGNLVQQSSPDTGITVNAYDAAGNLVTRVDAKAQTTTYAYDVLNRVTRITFADGSMQTYVYDQGPNGVGRLTEITEIDPTAQVTSRIAYGYDPHGRVLSESRMVAGQVHTVTYTYDPAGRLAGISYPSGRSLTYTLDGVGRITGIATSADSQSQVLVQKVQYHPFGGVKSYVLGNGQVVSRTIDLDGRIAGYTLGDESYRLSYDAASRINGIAQLGNSANDRTYGYDSLDRLTSAAVPGAVFGYSYDPIGDRLSKSVNGAIDVYAYSPTSNRIASMTPAAGSTRSFVFDANGSTTDDGVNQYAYDARGRMSGAASAAGMTFYQVNALGQRVRKTGAHGDTVFHYDVRGRLIAETDAQGSLTRELFYLGDIPVAVFQ